MGCHHCWAVGGGNQPPNHVRLCQLMLRFHSMCVVQEAWRKEQTEVDTVHVCVCWGWSCRVELRLMFGGGPGTAVKWVRWVGVLGFKTVFRCCWSFRQASTCWWIGAAKQELLSTMRNSERTDCSLKWPRCKQTQNWQAPTHSYFLSFRLLTEHSERKRNDKMQLMWIPELKVYLN